MKTNASTLRTATIAETRVGKKIVRPREMTAPEREIVKFRLYVADNSPNSILARANLTALCQLHFPGQHEIEIVDVFCEPARARDEGVTMTPMLLKVEPLPARRIVGPLTRTEGVLAALGLTTIAI